MNIREITRVPDPTVAPQNDPVEIAARALHAALRRRGDSPDMAAFDRLLPSAQAEYRIEARAMIEALGAHGFMRSM